MMGFPLQNNIFGKDLNAETNKLQSICYFERLQLICLSVNQAKQLACEEYFWRSTEATGVCCISCKTIQAIQVCF